MTDASAIPLFPYVSFEETLAFYRSLGFELTHHQEQPYRYGAVRLGGFDLHFGRTNWGEPKNAASTCLVFVAEVEPLHRAFADGLRSAYGKVPTAGLPRITRLKKGQTRFTVFDPSGNAVIYIQRDELDVNYYDESAAKRSKLAQAIENAAFFRDTYCNDKAAAKVLDVALARKEAADPIERARALAARAELAVAMGDADRARAFIAELEQIPLSRADRKRYREELQAADDLERWR